MTVIAVIISKESQENAASQNDPGHRLVLGCDVTKFFWTLDLSCEVLNTSLTPGGILEGEDVISHLDLDTLA